MSTCRTCKFLGVEPDTKGRFIARRHRVYPCLVEVDQPTLPASMTKSYGFKWPLPRSYMEPDDGIDCQMHQTRSKDAP